MPALQAGIVAASALQDARDAAAMRRGSGSYRTGSLSAFVAHAARFAQ